MGRAAWDKRGQDPNIGLEEREAGSRGVADLKYEAGREAAGSEPGADNELLAGQAPSSGQAPSASDLV